MPPTISPLFRLRLSALGEDLNTWGDPNLNNALKLIEEAVAGPLTLTITGNRTLTADNFQSNEYRRGTHALVAGVGLAAPFTITVPPVAYPYRIDNRTAFAATLKTASGVGAVVRPGMISAVFCDGTDCKVADPTLDQIRQAAGPVNLNGQQIQNAADGTAPGHLATVGQIPAVAATQVQLASDWAQKTSGTVDGTEYSAKLWATSTTALTGGNKGAKGYAQDASGSASAASGFATAASGFATNAGTSAGNAATSETNAANSATLSAQQAARLAGSSTTSNAIGLGSKTFTTQAGKFFDPGTRILISSDANPSVNTMFGTVTAYSGTSLTVNVTATTGTGTFTDWTLRVSGERGSVGPAGVNVIPRSARTSNTQLGVADSGTLIDFTANTFSQTIAAAGGLGAGWFVYLRNSGTGVITLDPNASELVDGLTTIKIYPGEAFTVTTDGTAFYSIGRSRLVLLSTTVVASSVASVDFTLGFDDPEISGARIEVEAASYATSATSTYIQLSNSGGFLTSGYRFTSIAVNTSSAVSGVSQTANQIQIDAEAAGGLKVFDLEITGVSRSANPATVINASFSLGGGSNFTGVRGLHPSLGKCTALRIIPAAGNITGGTFRHYGRRAP